MHCAFSSCDDVKCKNGINYSIQAFEKIIKKISDLTNLEVMSFVNIRLLISLARLNQVSY